MLLALGSKLEVAHPHRQGLHNVEAIEFQFHLAILNLTEIKNVTYQLGAVAGAQDEGRLRRNAAGSGRASAAGRRKLNKAKAPKAKRLSVLFFACLGFNAHGKRIDWRGRKNGGGDRHLSLRACRSRPRRQGTKRSVAFLKKAA